MIKLVLYSKKVINVNGKLECILVSDRQFLGSLETGLYSIMKKEILPHVITDITCSNAVKQMIWSFTDKYINNEGDKK